MRLDTYPSVDGQSVMRGYVFCQRDSPNLFEGRAWTELPIE